MKLSSIAFGLLALQAVGAQTLFTELIVIDVHEGPGACIRMPLYTTNATAPVTDITSDDMACGYNGTQSVSRVCKVQKGARLNFQFEEYPDGSHPGALAPGLRGPCSVYMKYVTSALNDLGKGDGWFKIYEQGFSYANSHWCTDDIQDLNEGLLSVSIPLEMAGGYYLVRTELMTLSDRDSTPSFYIGCAQIFLDSSETTLPVDLVKIPGYIQADDPSLQVNISAPPVSYDVPGPRVYESNVSPTIEQTGPVTQVEGLLPPNVVLINANWFGIELDSYSTADGCKNATASCWNQSTACFSGAGPIGTANCNIWTKKCDSMESNCNSGNYTGPPDKGAMLNPTSNTQNTALAFATSASSPITSGIVSGASSSTSTSQLSLTSSSSVPSPSKPASVSSTSSSSSSIASITSLPSAGSSVPSTHTSVSDSSKSQPASSPSSSIPGSDDFSTSSSTSISIKSTSDPATTLTSSTTLLNASGTTTFSSYSSLELNTATISSPVPSWSDPFPAHTSAFSTSLSSSTTTDYAPDSSSSSSADDLLLPSLLATPFSSSHSASAPTPIMSTLVSTSFVSSPAVLTSHSNSMSPTSSSGISTSLSLPSTSIPLPRTSTPTPSIFISVSTSLVSSTAITIPYSDSISPTSSLTFSTSAPAPSTSSPVSTPPVSSPEITTPDSGSISSTSSLISSTSIQLPVTSTSVPIFSTSLLILSTSSSAALNSIPTLSTSILTTSPSTPSLNASVSTFSTLQSIPIPFSASSSSPLAISTPSTSAFRSLSQNSLPASSSIPLDTASVTATSTFLTLASPSTQYAPTTSIVSNAAPDTSTKGNNLPTSTVVVLTTILNNPFSSTSSILSLSLTATLGATYAPTSSLAPTLATAHPMPGASTSPDGRCGSETGTTCIGYKTGSCCSTSGYCGSTPDYCGVMFCQPEWGQCDSTTSRVKMIRLRHRHPNQKQAF